MVPLQSKKYPYLLNDSRIFQKHNVGVSLVFVIYSGKNIRCGIMPKNGSRGKTLVFTILSLTSSND